MGLKQLCNWAEKNRISAASGQTGLDPVMPQIRTGAQGLGISQHGWTLPDNSAGTSGTMTLKAGRTGFGHL